MRRIFLTLTSLAVLAAACAPDAEVPADSRVGDRGLLRFNGGGCSGSTAMAVGSRETLTVEAVESQLPDELSARTSAPDVIAASMGGAHEVILEAHAVGRSRVEVLSAGHPYDWLTFTAEPAAQALGIAAPRVLEGGTFDLVVTDVFGDCKAEECRLFGHSFLGWRTEPAGALTLVGDDRGTMTFVAGHPANVEVIGREPARHADVLSASVSIEPLDGITRLLAELTTIPLEEGQSSVVVELPGSVPVDTAFCVRVDADRAELPSVAISKKDVVWTIDGGLEAVATDHASEPLGTVFVARTAGHASLTARVDLVHLERAFELEVTP